MLHSLSVQNLKPDKSYVKSEPLKIKQVKAEKIKMRNETVQNFAAAVLFGIALILIIKMLSWIMIINEDTYISINFLKSFLTKSKYYSNSLKIWSKNITFILQFFNLERFCLSFAFRIVYLISSEPQKLREYAVLIWEPL